MGKRLTFEQAQQRLIDAGQKLELLEFDGTAKSCKVRCKLCGRIFIASYFVHLISKGKNGNFHTACCCTSSNPQNADWRWFEERMTEINPDIELLPDQEWKGNKEYYNCRCKIDGHEWKALGGGLLNGTGCPKCAGNQLKTQEDYIAECKALGFEVLEEYKGNRIPIRHRCIECETEFIAAPSNILNGGIGCPHCRRSISIGEKFVADWLSSHDIEFIREYRVQINNRLHKMDFYLPDRNMIIEYDGQQHFMPVNFGGWDEDIAYEKFLDRQSQDRDKNKYCFDKHIKLLRIKYDMPFEKAAEVLMNILI